MRGGKAERQRREPGSGNGKDGEAEAGIGNWELERRRIKRRELGTGNWKGRRRELGVVSFLTDPRSRIPGPEGADLKDHKELNAWKVSMDFVVEVYAVTKGFPKEEVYGLTSQLRRAAVSIPSNIAEGAARNSEKEFVQFLHIALGSAAEAETQMLIAQRLGYMSDIESLLDRVVSVKKLISGLIGHYKAK